MKELAPPGIIGSGESVLYYEYLRNWESKMTKDTAIVSGTCADLTYLKKSKIPSPWYIPLRARVNSNGFYIKKILYGYCIKYFCLRSIFGFRNPLQEDGKH
jgi:hypothetical protein